MKTEQQVIEQREKLDIQWNKLWERAQAIDKAGIEAKDIYGWAKCIEAGREALDWVLADATYVNIVY